MFSLKTLETDPPRRVMKVSVCFLSGPLKLRFEGFNFVHGTGANGANARDRRPSFDVLQHVENGRDGSAASSYEGVSLFCSRLYDVEI